ncbi:MAG: flagellar biosynthetic protein FliO [Myxococcota bacterium]|nr:flagellar biosynthetic protein FliO [Myxococcota bacterium]
MYRKILILLFAVIAPTALLGSAAHANTLNDVLYTGSSDRIEFRFKTNQPVEADSISARTEGAVLVVTLSETKVKRHWLNLKDVDIKRALVHPSRRGADARLRVRFHQALPNAVIQNIRVRQENGRLVISIPRDEKTALYWSSNQPSAPQNKNAKPQTDAAQRPAIEPTKTIAQAETKSAPVVAATPAVEPTSQVDREPVETPIADKTSKQTATVGSDEKPADANPVTPQTTNALGQTSNDGPRIGAFAMAMLFLVCVGLVMFRKLRNRTTAPGDGPMIKPVSTHMLGPKQGLLLVDVAGDMVLLGTSDKGVQMLTKIDGREMVDTDALSKQVTPTDTQIPMSAIEANQRPAFAERFGRAISRIREATQGTQQYAAYHANATRRQDEESGHLDHLLNKVEDVHHGASGRNSRRDFAPLETRAEESVYAAQPPVVQNDDLLNKLRSLQGA